ncbi:formyl transferase domain-containing protein [Phthorimaea operculella]|nr:formyl transferase domain-containing protein [Phthorimaea operculella]
MKALAKWCKDNSIDLVVIGPEDPLADGIVDALSAEGIPCFGPNKRGAQIEANKDWSKKFMDKYQLPTARYQSFSQAGPAKEFINNAPFPALVVKASGLAAGKGVVVATTKEEACQAVDEILTDAKYGAAGETVVIEEVLEGDEVSVLAFTDGETVAMMPPAQDHKRIGDGDTGPNTGGMGAYCPCPLITADQLLDVKDQVLQRAVDGLKAEGIKYVGVLYAGLMVTKAGPMVLEFNCRFGDPETQVLMTLLESDLYTIMKACVDGTLKQHQVQWNTKLSAVGVVIASKGYPETSTKGCVISGLSQVQANPGIVVFHSGVARGANGSLVSAGGRVLLVCARAASLRAAAAAATAAAAAIDFPGAQYRKDIAHRAFSKLNGLSYLQSGVDIDAAATLVKEIEPIATATHRRGVLGRLGCFSGLFQLSAMDPTLKDPVLVQGTDGVGTKLKIAEIMNKYDTIGQDLVAMCVNDILCAGAEPFAFLDYMACGRLQVDVATTIVRGIANACIASGCALLGGETAEMPSMYEVGKYDLAGFAVGVVDNMKQLPRSKEIRAGDVVLALPSTGVHSNGYSLVQKIMNTCGHEAGDVVLALPSTGVHSNGYSLVQKIMNTCGHEFQEKAPFSDSGKSFGEEFLTPTGLYVNALLPAIKKGVIKGLAHITGGGLLENIPRILPPGIRVKLDAKKFTIKPIFGWLQAKGMVSDFEMLRTFNCGVGMVVIVDPVCAKEMLELVKEPITIVGSVENIGKEGGHQVVVDNFKEAMAPLTAPYIVAGKSANQKSLSYKDSGVDIEAGDSLVSLIKPLARSTSRSGVIGGLGGFGGCFQLKAVEQDYKDPVLVLATDGVGTKLRVAQKINQHSTIGIDLVAMCVNDILCNGAAPLTFLDYFACGALDVHVARNVVSGVAEGCRQASAALIGGETAEMPGMYEPGVYDIAGFALGVVERSHILPKINDITVGDIIIGLPSNGVHSNGFSLIHKLVKKAGLHLDDKAPFSKEGLTLGEEFIKPTKIYVKSVLPALQKGYVKAVAHITGGGLMENIPRVIPENVRARLDAHLWNVHPVFAWIADMGLVKDDEMVRTFNCGVGMILVVSLEHQAEVMNITRAYGAMVIGSIQKRPPGGARVVVDNFASALDLTRRMPMMPKKRVAVLVSGNGSNLQALIDQCNDPAQCMCAEICLVISNKKDAFALLRAEKAGIPSLVSNLPSLHTLFICKEGRIQVSVLVSGNGSNLQALIDQCNDPAQCMCAEICLVISNKKDAFALLRAEKAGIPSLVSNLPSLRILFICKEGRIQVSVLVSGNGSNLQALIDQCNDPAQCMCAEICLVISNKKDAFALLRAEKAGIPSLVSVLVSGNGSNLQALIDQCNDPAQCMCAEICLVISNKKDAFALLRAEKAGIPSLVSNLPSLHTLFICKEGRIQVSVLVSGNGSNLQALIDQCNDPAQCMCAEICLVISNKKDAFALLRAEKAGIPSLVSNLPSLHTLFICKEGRIQVSVLVSGNGSNLQALIDQCNDPAQCMCAEICLVISNKKDAFALLRAEKAGIPSLVSVLVSGNGSNLQALIDQCNDPAQCMCAEICLVISNKKDAFALLRAEKAGIPSLVSVLVSGNGSNLQALIDQCNDPAQCMCAEICLVISNKKDAFALLRAEKAGIPSLTFNHKDYASREEFDRAISAALEQHKIDIVCLAGYMRILSGEFVQKWKGRLLNIHPSLLPRHPGLHAQKQCLDAGDKESGCTVHFVDEGMDTGPIIVQDRVPVLKGDTVDSLTTRIHAAEHRAYARALRYVATGRVRLSVQGQLMWTLYNDINIYQRSNDSKGDTVDSLTTRIHAAEHRTYARALRYVATGRVRLSVQGQLMWTC